MLRWRLSAGGGERAGRRTGPAQELARPAGRGGERGSVAVRCSQAEVGCACLYCANWVGTRLAGCAAADLCRWCRASRCAPMYQNQRLRAACLRACPPSRACACTAALVRRDVLWPCAGLASRGPRSWLCIARGACTGVCPWRQKHRGGPWGGPWRMAHGPWPMARHTGHRVQSVRRQGGGPGRRVRFRWPRQTGGQGAGALCWWRAWAWLTSEPCFDLPD